MEGLKAKVRFVQRGFETIHQYGVLRAVPMALFEIFYETKFASKTTDIIPFDDMDIEEYFKQHGNIYIPCPYYLAHRAFKQLDVDYPASVFVDFGSGLGRMMFFASQFPFRRIIGVELSETLCARASDTLAKYYRRLGKRSPEWQIVQSDAARFPVPRDANVFYFTDPFDEEILGPVVTNIVDSTAEFKRPISVVYVNPGHPDVFLRHGFGVLRSEVNRHGKGYMIMSR